MEANVALRLMDVSWRQQEGGDVNTTERNTSYIGIERKAASNLIQAQHGHPGVPPGPTRGGHGGELPVSGRHPALPREAARPDGVPLPPARTPGEGHRLAGPPGGHENGAPSVAVQGSVREEEASVVRGASQGVQGGLEDRVQRRPQRGGPAQDGALLLRPGVPDAALRQPGEPRDRSDAAADVRRPLQTEHGLLPERLQRGHVCAGGASGLPGEGPVHVGTERPQRLPELGEGPGLAAHRLQPRPQLPQEEDRRRAALSRARSQKRRSLGSELWSVTLSPAPSHSEPGSLWGEHGL